MSAERGRWRIRRGLLIGAACVMAALTVVACSNGARQPKIDPLSPSNVFENYQSARPLPANVVARPASLPESGRAASAGADQEESFLTGQAAGEPLASVPITVTDALLARGAERFAIYCAPCHGETGAGDGVVVEYGFPAPPPLDTPAVGDAPAGALFDIITHGRGQMFGYGDRVQAADRWAIVAFLYTLSGDDDAAKQ